MGSVGKGLIVPINVPSAKLVMRVIIPPYLPFSSSFLYLSLPHSPSLSHHPPRYHDMDNVVDFLVLESLYKISICTRWQEGDRFRSLIDGKFWSGTVEEKRAFR
jgi:hypothetical protein